MKKKGLLRAFTALTAAALLCSSVAMGAVPAQAAKKNKKNKKETKQEFDPNGTYEARLGIQSATMLWIMQLNYFDKDQNETVGTELDNKLFCNSKSGDGLEARPGTFEGAEIAGNGTYTVSLKDAEFDGETDISQLHIATNIPTNDKVKFTNVKATINGRTFAEFEEGYMEDQEDYTQGGMVVLIINHWRPELVDLVKQKGHSEDADNGYKLLQGTGQENIEITFTVSGFDYDNEAAVEQEETGEGTDAGSSGNAAQENSQANEDSSGSSAVPLVVGVVGLVVVIGVIVVLGKKKKSGADEQ